MAEKEPKKIAVLYHAECNDGFGAAFAAWKKFGESAEYIPVYHQTPPPAGLAGKDVFTLDYSYPKDIVQELLGQVRSLTIVDHHKTNQETVELATQHLFDLEHSGAVLAWMYFHPEKPLPRLFQHIEDYDLWRFRFPQTRALGIFLDSYPRDFERWMRFLQDTQTEAGLAQYVQEGEVLLRYRNMLVEQTAAHAQLVEFCGYRCLAVNSAIWASSLGSFLVKKLPPLAIVWYWNKDVMVFSLRSDGTADVAELAQRFGGGGHKDAAGFRLPPGSPLPFTMIAPRYK
ncbi:MAG: hypothetical protein HYW89_00975 [Candidatus Sungiibacteriota bacterium]|uniref:DHHA1 domain-containing protein n=1 Tax=Candidatus Sungiibacteriota bacterium TaxID=2750080 RepID=A0A7T5USB1_9BACT|nr:MAG: hypothetical protein HYW89_00975 [Candidatus Sungbacteria bacterium]